MSVLEKHHFVGVPLYSFCQPLPLICFKYLQDSVVLSHFQSLVIISFFPFYPFVRSNFLTSDFSMPSWKWYTCTTLPRLIAIFISGRSFFPLYMIPEWHFIPRTRISFRLKPEWTHSRMTRKEMKFRHVSCKQIQRNMEWTHSRMKVILVSCKQPLS